jgi:hypothetical protein
MTTQPIRKIALSEITKTLGLSKLIHQVEASSEAVVIRRENEDVAILFPYLPDIVSILQQFYAFSKTLSTLSADDKSAAEYLMLQSFLGRVAQEKLDELGIEAEISRGVTTALDSYVFHIELKRKLRAIQDQEKSKKNSLEESGSVSP